jgi:Tfp pilus assembly protein PilF
VKSKKARAASVAQDRPRAPETAGPNRSLLTAICIVLALATIVVYAQTFHYAFVAYDDDQYVYENPMVKAGLTASGIAWAAGTFFYANWHPLTWISYLLDSQLFGIAPGPFHLVNVLLHTASTVLLFLALFRMTRRPWRCAIVAGIFALHPLHVESVAWISERKDVLSGFFFMLTLLVYGRYVREKSEIRNPKSEGNLSRANLRYATLLYLLALLLFVLGLMSKPMLVTLPFVLLLLDYWPLRRFEAQSPQSEAQAPTAFVHLLVEKVPFFVIAAIFSVITVLVQRKEGAMSLAVPIVGRLGNAVVSYCRYIGKTFFPHDLAFLYPYESRLPVIAIVSASLLLAAISLLAIRWRRERPYLLIGWLWFVGTLIPVIGLIQVGDQAMADRYTYIPSIGLFIVLVWSAHDLTRRWQFQRSFFGLIAAAVALIWVLKTREQIGIWKNNETLFGHAIAVTRNNYIARNNLGATFERQGRWDEAAAQFRQAIADKPDYAQAHRNLGLVFERQGEPARAIEEYREAIRLNPSYADPHNALGVLFNAQGRVDEAVEEFRRALKLKPDYADAHFNLGLIYARKGQLDEAIREYQVVLEVQPGRADVHNNLGVALDNKGRTDDAIREYVDAIELDPNYARARFNLGVALAQKGALEPAIEQFQEALKLEPDYKEARTNLDALLQMRQKR